MLFPCNSTLGCGKKVKMKQAVLLAIVFYIIAILSALLSFGGILVGLAAVIAQIVFFGALVLATIFIVIELAV